jgi:Zinc-binding dehydrogenase
LTRSSPERRESRVIRASGVEGESELAVSVLHEMCAPLLDLLPQLAPPQRDALRVVFGLTDGPAPNHLHVGIGVVNLLSEAAQACPLVCAVDDAHWLDTESAQVLRFVARRLEAEPVALLFATRTSEAGSTFLPDLVLHALATEHRDELLRSLMPGMMERRVLSRLAAESDGNPLGLVEIARAVSVSSAAGGSSLLQELPVEDKIRQSFLGSLQGLPDGSRLLLLVAAIDAIRPGGTIVLFGATDPSAANLTKLDFIGHENARVQNYFSYAAAGRESIHSDLKALIGLLARGRLRPTVGTTVDWRDTGQALLALRSSEVAGKVVLRFLAGSTR